MLINKQKVNVEDQLEKAEVITLITLDSIQKCLVNQDYCDLKQYGIDYEDTKDLYIQLEKAIRANYLALSKNQ